MRWYDYLICVWFADVISTGLVHSQWILLISGLISYIAYENMRKQQ